MNTLARHWEKVFQASDIKHGGYVKIVGPSITGKMDYMGLSAEVIGFCEETNNYEISCKLGYGIFPREALEAI